MFKKLKDKLAEEVKSSPQRIQQFAQAAQAAVTSASSSVSDITNSDLFSIGDNDTQQPRPKAQSSLNSQPNTFQDVALVQPLQSNESLDYMSSHDMLDNQRQRRLSNSSFASDVSFRLPSYETPSSMYHLQSDIEVSASEAEERSFSSGTVSLDRVTKEQLYAAYRRTQERYTKYRTQYGDLARHYKLLERENAKARSVLVETQDKALRRISELREQCALEQSAKAHLEKALRIEIEEKNMKIETLNTKVQLLQNNPEASSFSNTNENKSKSGEDGDVQLINLSNDNDVKPQTEDSSTEIVTLCNKIEKMEQLLNKYKESLKTSKDKNSQLNTELQMLSSDLQNKNKEIEQFKTINDQLTESNLKVQELNALNEELQNQINTYEFNKTREISTLEVDYQKAQDEVAELRGKIEIFAKREEEYAISLAENKLSIHKELESKESEIKSLKDHLESCKKELQSLLIVINDYKNSVASLEAEKAKLTHDSSELSTAKTKISELQSVVEEVSKKCQNLEQLKIKADEGYKCLQLQMKQETAEKLAMVDRNTYLENRNAQLSEENSKKSTQIGLLENELHKKEKLLKDFASEDASKQELVQELDIWKDKYAKLESEIQEERDELIKLQSEIEKLLANHELLQTQNIEYRKLVSDLKSENLIMQEKIVKSSKIKTSCLKVASEIKDMKKLSNLIVSETKSLQAINNEAFYALYKEINYALNNISHSEITMNTKKYNELKSEKEKLENELKRSDEQREALNKEICLLQAENSNYKSTINEIELEKSAVDDEVKNIYKRYEMTMNELKVVKVENENLLQENNNYKSSINANESEKSAVDEKVKNISNRYEITMNELKVVKEENENLLYKIKELENNFQNVQSGLQIEKTRNMEYFENLNLLEEDKQKLLDQVQRLENKNKSVIEDLDTVKIQYNSQLEELHAIKNENSSLTAKIKDLDYKVVYMNKVQEDNKVLSLENISLKSQAESIANNYKILEIEINDVRKSHAKIVAEKDRLNEVIEKLERDASKSIQDCEIQTDLVLDDPETVKKVLDLQSSEIDKELPDKYQSLKTEHDLIKEENRRFKSDIEGLQTYLTKISKENSVLNDKLRELIATSENTADSNDVSNDLIELKKDVQTKKERIDDLMRENMLLVEENLELKDQLQSQNYPKVDTNSNSNTGNDTANIKEKYNNLLQVNGNLEKRLKDLEEMNKSVNGNMIQIQDKNEKLRLSNEKLERRLDEALVSLRHLHSLQENTELEYLRNILYEYLTGSGTHSVTLAKVLSAIVKFDDMQTKLVLQKEKERQGLLQKLGFI